MTVDEYFDALRRTLAAVPIVIQQSLVFRDSGIDTDFIKGDLLLLQEHRLYVAEYVLMAPIFTRSKYRFHL